MSARLPPDLMESACRQFLLRLSVDTIVHRQQFDPWRLAHWDELEDAFINSGEPEELKGTWLREVFAASRLLRSRPAAPALPTAERRTLRSSGRPAGVLARWFGRLVT